jgi:hypothetical protein
MEKISIRPFRTPSPSHSKNLNSQTTIRYIWQDSIPDSWKKIIEKKGISLLRIEKNDRSTLEFLKETQQYINFIRKPSELLGDSKSWTFAQSPTREGFLNETPKSKLTGSLSAERYRNYEGSPLPFITRDKNKQEVVKFWKKKKIKTKVKKKLGKESGIKEGKLKIISHSIKKY